MNENLAANRSKDAFRKEEASYRFDDTKTATYRNPQESKNIVVPGKVWKKSRNQLLQKKCAEIFIKGNIKTSVHKTKKTFNPI